MASRRGEVVPLMPSWRLSALAMSIARTRLLIEAAAARREQLRAVEYLILTGVLKP